MARRTNDFYETPSWMIHALLTHVPEISGTVFECCVGDGSIYRELINLPRVEVVLTNDIDETKPASYHYDAAQAIAWSAVDHDRSIDWVVTNPPFDPDIMVPILQNALATARVGVVLLGRVSFLEPTKARGAVLSANPPRRYLVTERHSFTGNGKSDSATTAWMVWSKQPLSGRPIEVLWGWKPR